MSLHNLFHMCCSETWILHLEAKMYVADPFAYLGGRASAELKKFTIYGLKQHSLPNHRFIVCKFVLQTSR